jgi:deazaflavin-dependent oxidoreductase (nitroreductase family)
MGLQQDLDYRADLPNPVQRGMQVVAETKPGSWLLQRTLYRLDRPLYRRTDGRVTIPGVVTGLPVIMLTTTGSKSGLPRSMPVVGIPLDDDIAVLGTNFAQPRSPAWALNLEADGRAKVAYRGREFEVVARPATEEERERAWDRAVLAYRGFKAYRARITERPVRIFVLERPTPG